MKFEELLEKQKVLNEAIGSYPETREKLSFALIEEAGEVARAYRQKWRWWTWNGKAYEFSREQLIEELNDILKFLLVGILAFAEPDERTSAIARWENEWEDVSLRFDADDIGYLLAQLTVDFVTGSDGDAVYCLTQICQLLEVSREDIEAAYLKKWGVNQARIAVENGGAA